MPSHPPSLLYGTAWKEDDTERCVRDALAAGFRGIDTANQRKHYYEEGVGRGIAQWIKSGGTREQLYLQLHAELPYASAVETEKWEDRKDGSTVIHQQILIERDSQKAIVVGKGGSRLKAIGQAAREAIAEHLSRKVHLFLHVKVNPRWDEDRTLYQDIGLDWSE